MIIVIRLRKITTNYHIVAVRVVTVALHSDNSNTNHCFRVMTRSARQRRARAVRMQAAEEADARHTSLFNDDAEQSDQQSELYEMIHYDQEIRNNNNTQSVSQVLNSDEREIMEMLDLFETLLADPYLPEIELNDILSQQAECIHQFEVLRQQNVDDSVFHGADEVHHDYNEEGNIDFFHHESVGRSAQLDEQIREIEQFEAMQQQNERYTERNPARAVPPVVHRPSNRNRSFKGYILNPNQDEATTDDSTNTHTSTTTASQSLSSPGSSTTILSADFGDGDVLPIEETSCVICCEDYRHRDEIVRNANAGRTNNDRISHIAAATCNHVFHTKCITSWIQSSGKSDCPCCRCPFALIATTYREPSTNSNATF